MKIDINELSIYRVQAGDIIVVNVDDSITDDIATQLKSYIQPFFPKNEIIIFGKQIRMAIVRPS